VKYRPRKYVAPPEGSLWSDQAARYLGIALTVLDAWLHDQGRTNRKPVASAA
jgi:hypothetical protein